MRTTMVRTRGEIAMGVGLGPVFHYEWLRTSRSWRLYGVRVLFGVALLLVLGFVAFLNAQSQPLSTTNVIRRQAEEGQAFSLGIILTQISMILLVAPAATASAICLDKQRGTMAHVLVTDLSNAEIVLGKLAARLLPTISLVMSSLGVMAICTLMGGIDPVGLTGAVLVSLGCALLAGTLAFGISVYAGKTHEVLMATYLVLIAWLCAYPFGSIMRFAAGWPPPPDWLALANPFWLVTEMRGGPIPLQHHGIFFGGCVAVATMLTLIATMRIRRVAILQMNRPARKGKPAKEGNPRRSRMRRATRMFSPSLDRNPVLWREWHRSRPSRWMRVIGYVYVTSVVAAMTTSIWSMATSGSNRGPQEVSLILVNGMIVAVGLLLLSVSASTALAEERVRGSLDVLLSTPLSTASILRGKWWGAFRAVPMIAILPGVLAAFALAFNAQQFLLIPTGALAVGMRSPLAWGDARWLVVVLLTGLTLSYGAAITSFGLAMATWIERLDRAVAATVATYVFLTVGWCILCMMAFQHEQTIGAGLASASPFMGIAYTGSMVHEPSRLWDAQVAWATFWILANTSAAVILYRLTRITFDRKMGRIPEEGMTRRAVINRSG